MGVFSNDDFGTSRGPALGLRAAFFGIMAVALMITDQRTDLAGRIRHTAYELLQPIRTLAQLPMLMGQVGQHLQSRGALLAQNTDLLHERLLLRARLQHMEALESENDRLRAMLQSARTINQTVLVAEILDVSSDPYRHQIVLNKGKLDGITEGQALIDAHGILGQVSEVFEHSSTALLLTDPKSSIPVEINRNGLRTIARGQGKALLSLPFLPTNADIQEGDLLVSSGLGGRYPAGYPVAKVQRVDNQIGLEFLGLQAEPLAQMHHGHQVLLIAQQTIPKPHHKQPKAAAAPAKKTTKLKTPPKVESSPKPRPPRGAAQ